MAKPGPKKGEGGRPKIPDPDWDELQRLARVHCTGDDCAYVLGISYDTLSRRVQEKYSISFADYLKKEKEFGKSSLRKAMMNAVIKGSVPMMIWLSKNWLGMRDNPEEIFEQKPTIIKTKDGVEIKLGFNKKKESDSDGDKSE
jgi:hypothetical protein